VVLLLPISNERKFNNSRYRQARVKLLPKWINMSHASFRVFKFGHSHQNITHSHYELLLCCSTNLAHLPSPGWPIKLFHCLYCSNRVHTLHSKHFSCLWKAKSGYFSWLSSTDACLMSQLTTTWKANTALKAAHSLCAITIKSLCTYSVRIHLKIASMGSVAEQRWPDLIQRYMKK
jgi:hypothetical protein